MVAIQQIELGARRRPRAVVFGYFTHPQTQGKIERWHQTLKNCFLSENYYLSGDLEQKISDFVSHYNHQRYHESIANLTPADVYFGRGQTILLEREGSNTTTKHDACIIAAKAHKIKH